MFGYIDNIKTDFVRHHQYPIIQKSIIEDNFRLMSMPDIIAMKVNAVLRRAVKKDFWHIAELLNHYSIEDFIECYQTKYPSQQLAIAVPQALSYFADAEDSEDLVSLKAQTWTSVKEQIGNKVREFLA